MENEKKIAVLIDADNVSDKYIKYIFDEISNHGTPTYKRIYGDWTKPQLASWKSVLLNYSITPIQQYSYTTGKNATDSALIIDAMDILYSKNVDGFCIISSDSDFTRLAARLREAGMYVIGMGEKKTPTPFIAACEKFKYLEVLAGLVTDVSVSEEMSEKQQVSKEVLANRGELIKSIKNIIAERSDEEGWVGLGEVGTKLSMRYPDFDTRNYGHSKLSSFILSLNRFEIEAEKTNKRNLLVRNKVKK